MAVTIGVLRPPLQQLIESITTDREPERLLLNLTPITEGLLPRRLLAEANSHIVLRKSAEGDDRNATQ